VSVRSRAKHRVRRKPLGRPFTKLWAGFTLASSGDGLMLGAVPLMAVVIDPSPLAVSSVAAANNLPWLLLALPAGAFADRFARGTLMAASNLVRALAIAAGAFLILDDRMTLAILIAVVLINAGGRAMYYSAAQAIVPELVHLDALEHANGLFGGTEAGAEELAGPVVGTWLFAVSRAIPFFADAVVTV
jgi:MFS family permease